MKKMTGIMLTALAISAFAAPKGADVYKKYCQSCHMLTPPGERKRIMQLPKEKRRLMLRKMMKKMKAPPMSKVSAKLKYDLNGDRAKILAFIQDYIVHPKAEKARCMPRALHRFGVMPPIGQALTPAERKAVAEWIVDRFRDEWQPNEGQKGCRTQ